MELHIQISVQLPLTAYFFLNWTDLLAFGNVNIVFFSNCSIDRLWVPFPLMRFICHVCYHSLNSCSGPRRALHPFAYIWMLFIALIFVRLSAAGLACRLLGRLLEFRWLAIEIVVLLHGYGMFPLRLFFLSLQLTQTSVENWCVRSEMWLLLCLYNFVHRKLLLLVWHLR